MALRSRFALAVDGLVALAMATVAGCSGNDGAVASVSSSSGGPVSSSSSGGSSSGHFERIPSDAGSPITDEDSYACTEESLQDVAGLQPGIPVDYLEIRTQYRYPPVQDAGVPIPGKGSTGTPCASATCRDALASATADGWTYAECSEGTTEILVYSRGEDARAVGKADVGTFLAPIDTPEEARLMLFAAKGYTLYCNSGKKTGWRKNTDGSYEILANTGGCGSDRGQFHIERDGTVTLVAEEKDPNAGCVCGRRFEGLASTSSGAPVGLAEFLAETAYLEAASVIAFRRFEEELARLGAPKAFLARARASRADEIRHARTMAWLAKVHGGTVKAVEPSVERSRSLFDIALENAVEGCVRESYGALVAAYQAKNAQNQELRRAMQIIAVDEAKHAELAHDVEAWFDKLLNAEERARIAVAKAEALAELERAALVAPAEDVRVQAGVPSPAAARALLSGLTLLGRAA